MLLLSCSRKNHFLFTKKKDRILKNSCIRWSVMTNKTITISYSENVYSIIGDKTSSNLSLSKTTNTYKKNNHSNSSYKKFYNNTTHNLSHITNGLGAIKEVSLHGWWEISLESVKISNKDYVMKISIFPIINNKLITNLLFYVSVLHSKIPRANSNGNSAITANTAIKSKTTSVSSNQNKQP
jgi:hypothetical protein